VVAVDLVGPMPPTPRGNSWILVLTDHFTRWANAQAIPDTSAITVARVLDQHVFCYFGLPEQIHLDQGAQLQSQLMSDLCRLWVVNQSRTTPYHPQGNGVVERNNRMLGDALRSLLLGCSQEEWDTVLPQVMRAYRSTYTPVLVRPQIFWCLAERLGCLTTPPTTFLSRTTLSMSMPVNW